MRSDSIIATWLNEDKTKNVALLANGSVYTCERSNRSAIWPPMDLIAKQPQNAIDEVTEMLELVKTQFEDDA